MPRSPRLLLPLLLLISAWLGACSPPPATAADPDRPYDGPGPIRVVCTTAMIGDLAARIGGERVAVTTLMGPGVDPHLYQPTAADLRTLDGADLILYSGLHLEGKMTDIFGRLASRRPVLAVTDPILADPAQLLDAGGNHDPHVWMDVRLWAKAAEAIAARLVRFDPDHAAAYQTNAAALRQDLTALDDYARRSLASIPAERRVLVTAHDAFGYLARAYGLEVRGIQGISTESEAGLRDLEQLVNFLVERRIPAVFVESSVPHKSVQALVEGARARGHEVRIGGELFSDAMGPAGTYEGTYPGMIDHNVTTITRALGGEAPERGLNDRLGH